MKLLLNGAALAALVLCPAGDSSAQIGAKRPAGHAAAADPAGWEDGPAIDTAVSAPRTPDPAAAAPATEPATLNAEEQAFFTALGQRVTNAAAAYESYVRAAAAIDPHFTEAAQVQAALRAGEDYNPDQLQEGVIAYAAVLALRSQAFVDGIRARADASLADRLIADPGQVLRIRGADEAAQDVSGVMRAQANDVLLAGQSISQAAYTVQHAAWSKSLVSQPDKVLSTAKASALKVLAADARARGRLLDSISRAAPAGGGGTTQETIQGLALAAVAMLGQAGDANEGRFQSLLNDARGANCLKMARMNLNQCLSVAGPQYEDVFCLGRHAVGETAQCLSSAANGGGGATLRTASLQSPWPQGPGPEN